MECPPRSLRKKVAWDSEAMGVATVVVVAWGEGVRHVRQVERRRVVRRRVVQQRRGACRSKEVLHVHSHVHRRADPSMERDVALA